MSARDGVASYTVLILRGVIQMVTLPKKIDPSGINYGKTERLKNTRVKFCEKQTT